MNGVIAKVAVSAATYWIDRPYDYLVPENLVEKAVPGARVYVPFARGNRRSEGIILALHDHSEVEPLLPIPNRTVKRLCADDSRLYFR